MKSIKHRPFGLLARLGIVALFLGTLGVGMSGCIEEDHGHHDHEHWDHHD